MQPRLRALELCETHSERFKCFKTPWCFFTATGKFKIDLEDFFATLIIFLGKAVLALYIQTGPLPEVAMLISSRQYHLDILMSKTPGLKACPADKKGDNLGVKW